MTAERRQQIEDVFHAALELDSNERDALLTQACGQDALLRREVESLLAYKQKSASPLRSSPVVEAFRLLAESHVGSLEGQTVDHYKFLTLLGAGGMGEVYLAEDVRLGRKAALKLLPAFFTRDADQVHRFHQEARAASSLNHPNIVTIYEFGQSDSLHFIAMEFVAGETLRQQMQRTGNPVREVVNVAIQVASGLSAAHQAGIVHRDIKPENIMFGTDGYVKVLDFGIAKFKEQQTLSSYPQSEIASAGNTRTSALAGTLSYMSPEQARGEPLDARTDIFSLGIVLYEMVTGRRPFEGDTQEETLHAILNDDAQPLRALRQDVPSDLERIIAKALERNRDERYQSARVMLADLREFNEETDRAMDAKERANRMLRQYLSMYAVDKRVLIPITKLWFVRRYSDLERGERGKELLKKSLRSGLLKTGVLLLLLAVCTFGLAAALSVSEEWEVILLSDGHIGEVAQAAFSPDGKLLVSVGHDAKVIVWDFARRERLATFSDHHGSITAVAFSPDGKWFATSSRDETIIVWDALLMEKVATLPGQRRTVRAITFSRDGKLLITPSTDFYKKNMWQVGRWQQVGEIVTDDFGPHDLLLSPDSQWILSPHWIAWDLATGRAATKYDAQSKWDRGVLSPDFSRLVSGDAGGFVTFWDVSRFWKSSERKMIGRYRGHQDNVRAVSYSPDGKLVVSGGEDIVVWDAHKPMKLARLGPTPRVSSLAFSPDGHWLASAHGDGSILVWDMSEREQVANFKEHGGDVQSVSFSPDGKRIVSASEDRSAIIWDAVLGKKEAVLAGHHNTVTGVTFSSDGRRVASCDRDGGLIFWDGEKRQPLWSVEATRKRIDEAGRCVAISPDRRWVASSFGIYESAEGRLVVNFHADSPEGFPDIRGIDFSRDGRHLAYVTSGGQLVLWDVGSQQLLDAEQLINTNLISVRFSPDGKWLVTGEDQQTVRLWEIEPLRQVAVIGDHGGRINSVVFSPDGKQVASAGDDHTIALWDVERRSLITRIGTHIAPVRSIAFSPDGKQLASGEEDNSVRIYTRHRTLWGYRWN